MRRLVLLVVLAFAAPVDAQPVIRDNERPAEPTIRDTERPTTPAPMTERQVKQDYEWKGPSGFWTNPRPAKGGAYRWRMMAIGGGVLLVTGILVLRLVRKR